MSNPSGWPKRFGVPAYRKGSCLIPGAGHSFIGPTAVATREATYRAIDETLTFIDEILGSGDRSTPAD